jgi:hypothetical protein
MQVQLLTLTLTLLTADGFSAGFAKRAQSVPLSPLLHKLEQGYRIIFTGFSQGSAVAALILVQLLKHWHLRPQYVTKGQLLFIGFGCPLIGDRSFATLLKTQTFEGVCWSSLFHHYINQDDIVPGLLMLAGLAGEALQSKLQLLVTIIIKLIVERLPIGSVSTVLGSGVYITCMSCIGNRSLICVFDEQVDVLVNEVSQLLAPRYEASFGYWTFIDHQGTHMTHFDARDSVHAEQIKERLKLVSADGTLHISLETLQRHLQPNYRARLQNTGVGILESAKGLQEVVYGDIFPIEASQINVQASRHRLQITVHGDNSGFVNSMYIPSSSGPISPVVSASHSIFSVTAYEPSCEPLDLYLHRPYTKLPERSGNYPALPSSWTGNVLQHQAEPKVRLSEYGDFRDVTDYHFAEDDACPDAAGVRLAAKMFIAHASILETISIHCRRAGMIGIC